jgi:putative endonuclease
MSQTEFSNKEKGDKGEQKAMIFLMGKGYTISQLKWKHGKYEIDIIAQHGNNIVFVEVKTRYSDAYLEPWEAVSLAKRRKICISANAYIQACQTPLEPRFDIVSIIIKGNNESILHIENAFVPAA